MGGVARRLRRARARESAYTVPDRLEAALTRLRALEERVARLEASQPQATLVATPGGLLVPRDAGAELER